MNKGTRNARRALGGHVTGHGAVDYFVAHAFAAGFRLLLNAADDAVLEMRQPDGKDNGFSLHFGDTGSDFHIGAAARRRFPDLIAATAGEIGAVRANLNAAFWAPLTNVERVDRLLGLLRGQGAWPSKRAHRRFKAVTFEAVTAQHFLEAARKLAQGHDPRPFGQSTDYDLLFDGLRLPPKAVFGLAASEALGFPVRPENFNAGEDMVCFRMLRAAGFEILRKGVGVLPAGFEISREDRLWAEGRPLLIQHLRRERATGVAAAKRDDFRKRHGRLYCERCKEDPIEKYGSEDGEACIEVHHRDVHLADMTANHLTRLDDLQCLCASCHRVTHRELRSRSAHRPNDNGD